MIVPFIAVTRYFIHNKCRPSNIPKKCQIINQSLADKFPNYSLGNFFFRVHEDFGNSFPSYKRNSLLVIFWTKHLPLISRILKFNSMNITRNCLEQIEFVVAHRIRRGQQMISLYSRLWDERALRLLLQRMKSIFQRKTKHFVIGSTFVAFNWDNERITVDEMKSHLNELNVCKILRSKACNGYNGKHGSISAHPECSCDDYYPEAIYEWEPFLIEDDLTVWKKPHNNFKSTGLYCYKLYGRYEDVTADDFLQVFLDTDNRTKWDTHAADLKIIDTEPVSHSEVIYWETRWPTLFSNRDYVFKRRYYKDEVNKVIIVLNKSTEHPLCPPNSSKARVTEYWSYMVIKAKTDLNEPGMEFSLTYFDNPGIVLPTTISLWVTVQGMPEYLKRLKIEALAVSERRKIQGLIEETDKKDSEEKKCNQTPPSPPGGLSSTADRDSELNIYDYIFIFSSYFQKLRTSLWM